MNLADRKIFVALQNEDDYRLFSVKTLRGSLQNGLLQKNDLAWCEGMSEWEPLSKVLETIEKNCPSPVKTGNGNGNGKHPQVPAPKLAESCFQLAMSFQDSCTKIVRELQAVDNEEDELNYGQIWIELVYLGFFAVDQAIQETLEQESKDAVTGFYRSRLYQLKVDGINSFCLIKTRLRTYAQEAQASRLKLVDSQIGVKFADFCGNKENKRLIEIGGSLFRNVYQQAARALHSIETEKKIFH